MTGASAAMQSLDRTARALRQRGRDRISEAQGQIDSALHRTIDRMDANLAADRARVNSTAMMLTSEIHGLGASLRAEFHARAAIARARIAQRAAVYAESVNPVERQRSDLLGEMEAAQTSLLAGTEAAQQKLSTIDTRAEVEQSSGSIQMGALTETVNQADGTSENRPVEGAMAAAVQETILAFVPARAALI